MNTDQGQTRSAADLLEDALQARCADQAAQARELAAAAVDLARDAAEPQLLATALNILARAERDLGHAGVAIEHYTQLEDLCRRENDLGGVAQALRHQADIQLESGLGELADSLYLEAIEIYRGDPGSAQLELANALRGRALLKSHARRPDEARALWAEARELYQASGITAGVDECDFWLKSLAEQ